MVAEPDKLLARIGISIPSDLLEIYDAYIDKKGYTNRSEAIRDLIRETLIVRDWEIKDAGKTVAGTITYVYDHHKRELVNEIIELQHACEDQVISSMHVHLDHHNCLETVVVKGNVDTIKYLFDSLKALKGVKHCTISMTTTGADLS